MNKTYGIPYLQLDDLVIYLHAEGTKFNSNGNLMFLFKLIIHYSLHKARFTNTSVSNNDQFKKMILCTKSLIANYIVGHGLQLFNLILLHCFLPQAWPTTIPLASVNPKIGRIANNIYSFATWLAAIACSPSQPIMIV